MLQPYEVVEIPSAETPEAARALLQRFAHEDIPAVVIRNVDTAGVPQAISQIAADLPDGVRTEAHTREFEFGNVGDLGHIGLHADYTSPVKGAAEIPITYHLTHSGLAVASLFGIGSGFGEYITSQGGLAVVDRAKLEGQVTAGEVDAKILHPVCYRTELAAGSLLVFKNGAPYWHWMDTRGEGRRSTAVDSAMAVTPGMNITFLDQPLPPPRSTWDDPLPSPN